MKKILIILFTAILISITSVSYVFADDEEHNNDLTLFPDDTYTYYLTTCPSSSSGFPMSYIFNVVTGDNKWTTDTYSQQRLKEEYIEELSYEEGMAKFREVLANGTVFDGSTTNLNINSFDMLTSYRTYEFIAYNEASSLWYTSCHFSLFLGIKDNSINCTSYGEGTGYQAYEGGFNALDFGSSNTNVSNESSHQFLFHNQLQSKTSRHPVYLLNSSSELIVPQFAYFASHRLFPTSASGFYTSNTGFDKYALQIIVDHSKKIVIISDHNCMLGVDIEGIKTSGAYTSRIKYPVSEVCDPIFQEFTYDGVVYNTSGSVKANETQEIKLLYSEQVGSIVTPAYITSEQFKTTEASSHGTSSVPFSMYSNYLLNNDALSYYIDKSGVQHQNPFLTHDASLYTGTTLETYTSIDDDFDSSTDKVKYQTRTWRFNGTYINTNFFYFFDPTVPLPGEPDIDDEDINEMIKGDVYGSTCSFGLPVQTIYPKVLDLSSELGQKLKAAHAESTGDDSTFLADTSVLYFNMTNTLNNVTVAGYIFFNNSCLYFDSPDNNLVLGGYWKGFSDADIDAACKLYMATSVDDEYLDSNNFTEMSYVQFFGHALPNGDNTNYGTMEFTAYPFDYYDSSNNKKIGYKYVAYLCHTYKDMPVKMIFYPLVYEDGDSDIANYDNGYSMEEFIWNDINSTGTGEINTNDFNNIGNETGTNNPYHTDDAYVPTGTQDFAHSVSQLVNLHDQLDTYNNSINNYLNEYIGFFSSDFDLLSNSSFMSSATNTRDFIDGILGNQYIAPVLYVVLCIMLVIIALR